ncbi:unnamed protein product [Kuraishia capsulata CBS 1993]|uniref:Nucleolar complex protein 2 n=1 Tax=Kuraishia capsulata CBS 1993 TaxID=1382522 RepID=W6MY39_9ASCO|nr:uncharacterized protein KUCA_T00005959001 [Kuraishia capsulata CBS 1993]CDK29965.1 unnamed protein product [Kuraishia capsulata CBS 1993]
MGKVSKKTKKFQSKHLDRTIKHRREVQKHNKLTSKGKGKSASAAYAANSDTKESKAKNGYDAMNVEEFFEGGFEVPKASTKKGSKSKLSKKESESESDSDSKSNSESDSESESEVEVGAGSDGGSGSESDEGDLENDMKNLAEKDPEFFKYLQENDKELLDFKPVNPLDAMSEDEDEDEDEASNPVHEQDEDEEPEVKRIEVTMKMVKDWSDQLSNKPSVATLKNVVIAFKSAVNINSDNDYKYSVTGEKVFNQLMILVLKKFPFAVQRIVPYKKSGETRVLPSSNKKLAGVSSVLKSHAGSLITLLTDITNTETAALVLSSLQELLPFYISRRKLLKQMLVAVINVWSSTNDVDTQIATFAFINNTAHEFPKATLEICLKTTYSTFVKRCRVTNVHTLPMINFQKNSAVELFKIDHTLSYQIGFEYIRQLAIHLKTCLNNATEANQKLVYNWQFCHSLDFWSRVLAAHANNGDSKKESPLTQLIYPLVQVTLGTIRLIPTAQFFPLRFYLIRSLIRISQATGVFIPIFPLLSEILNSTIITKNPHASNLPAVDFEYAIKVNQAYLHTKVYQDGVCEQFVEIASEFFVLYSKNIAFPELAAPALIHLRRFVKKSRNVRFNKQLSNLIEKLNQNVKFITDKRAKVEFGPSNRVEVNTFLQDLDWEKTPLGAYVEVQRRVKDERTRLMRESILAEEEERKAQKNAEMDLEENSTTEELDEE